MPEGMAAIVIPIDVVWLQKSLITLSVLDNGLSQKGFSSLTN
jgi:hypothetical protein